MVSSAIKTKAYSYGAQDIVNSWQLNKKYAVYYNDRWIHFGDIRYDDFTTHKDPDRRRNYRSRASKITNKYGITPIKIKIMQISGHIIFYGKSKLSLSSQLPVARAQLRGRL